MKHTLRINLAAMGDPHDPSASVLLCDVAESLARSHAARFWGTAIHLVKYPGGYRDEERPSPRYLDELESERTRQYEVLRVAIVGGALAVDSAEDVQGMPTEALGAVAVSLDDLETWASEVGDVFDLVAVQGRAVLLADGRWGTAGGGECSPWAPSHKALPVVRTLGVTVEQPTPVKSDRAVTHKALISAHGRAWPRVANDLRNAYRNGLAVARVEGKQGWVYEDAAVEWAAAQGKYDAGLRQTASTARMADCPTSAKNRIW